MRKLMIGAILSVAFACSIFFYAEWENRRFVDSLPTSPMSEHSFKATTHFHEGSHEEMPTDSHEPEVLSTASDAAFQIVAEENTTAETITENDNPVDATWQNEALEPTGKAWQNDDIPLQTRTRSPFARKLIHPDEMDPDEMADMIHESLLQRFGDIPEVHTFVALKRKKFKNEPLTLDEHIDYTAAQLHLFPHPETRKTLDIFLEKRATEYLRSTRIVR